MLEYSQVYGMNELDIAILRELQDDGRLSNVELARRINLSPPATHARIKRLEEQGLIRQYVALLDPVKVGYDMVCFVSISLQLHQSEELEAMRRRISRMPEVLECFHVTGEFDYLLKVVVRNRQELQHFVVERITPMP